MGVPTFGIEQDVPPCKENSSSFRFGSASGSTEGSFFPQKQANRSIRILSRGRMDACEHRKISFDNRAN